MIIKVGSRGSQLAILQAESVVRKLKKVTDANFNLVKIRTSGDSSLAQKKLGSGIFEKEVDEALIRGDIDLAVHSMKDVPTAIPEGIILAAIPERLPANDVFISREFCSIGMLPAGATIGTSSLRRAAQIRSIRRDICIVELRGNIETRLKRLSEGAFQGIVIAQAALMRIGGLCGKEEILSTDQFPTSPGQGALAVMARRDDKEMNEVASKINCEDAMEEITAERAFLKKLGCGCSSPVGCTASAKGKRLKIKCRLYSIDGCHSKLFQFDFDRGDPCRCGEKAASIVLEDENVRTFWGLGS